MSLAIAPAALRVALLGFGDFERSALVSYLRLSGSRVPAYAEVESLADADYVVADTDHAGTLDAVLGADRVADTVFVGSLAPEGALAWMMRPIDPLQVLREIDATVALRQSQAQPTQGAAAAPTPSTPMPGTAAATQAHAPTAGVASEHGSTRRAGDASAATAALLVDDSEIALRYLERQLQAMGLRTDTAAHSQRALELLALNTYDVIFLDVDLGPHSELDGLALCQQIKRQPPATVAAGAPRVVLVSAHNSATDRVRGSFAGCDLYMAKPLDEGTLRRSLRKLGLRLSESAEGGYSNSRPGALSSRPMRLDPSR